MQLLRSVKIIDSQSPYNGQIKDILIDNGRIAQINDNIQAASAEVLSGTHWHVSPGWADMRTHAHDPGHEHKEDLYTACMAAAAGGFTDIAILPNTTPALDSKDTLVYVRQKMRGQGVSVHPIGAVTKECAGKDFTEMIDLTHAGAVAFSDGLNPIHNTHILLKSLQYLQQVNRVLINRPEDYDLTIYGQMNEGATSTLLGMRGIPHIAEELMLRRDLKLLEYALAGQHHSSDAPILHFSTISTAAAVQLIRDAKAQGLPVSCDVAAHQVAFDDSALIDFDTYLKVNPPFRSQADIAALWQGLADGTIDAIVSDHQPHDDEAKNLEFDLADFGIIGLETAFSVVNTHNKTLSLSQLIDKFTYAPRRILRLPPPTIAVGAPAQLTVFDPTLQWTFDRSLSKSKNSPFLGKTLRGKAVMTFNLSGQ